MSSDGTFTMAGLMADAGAARPRSGQAMNACRWNGITTPKAFAVSAHLTQLARRLRESSP